MTGSVTYNIVMSGVIRDGFEIETVVEALARLVNIPRDKAKSMVGTRRIIKKGSSSELAKTIKKKFWDIGLEIVLEGSDNKVTQPKKPPTIEFTDTQITQITEVATKDQVEDARFAIFGSVVCPNCELRQTKAKKCSRCGKSVLKEVDKKSFKPVVENQNYMGKDSDGESSPGRFAFLSALTWSKLPWIPIITATLAVLILVVLKFYIFVV